MAGYEVVELARREAEMRALARSDVHAGNPGVVDVALEGLFRDRQTCRDFCGRHQALVI
nr:hypothetical protein [Sinorhizobium americanum]